MQMREKVYSFCVTTINYHILSSSNNTTLSYSSEVLHKFMYISKVWHVSHQANIKVLAGLGSLVEGPCSFMILVEYWFLAAVGLMIPFFCCHLMAVSHFLESTQIPTFLGMWLPFSIFKVNNNDSSPSSVKSVWLIASLLLKLEKVFCF